MGRVTTVRTRKPATGAWSTIATSIVYQPLSNLVASFIHGNGLVTTNTHMLDYELSRCQVTDGALALIDRSYTRSDKLNITGVTDAVAAGPWGSKTYTYDGTGNRTSDSTTPPGGGTVVDSAGYPPSSNRIADVVTGTTTTRTFTHDGAGNIVTDVRSGSSYTFGYNARGRLATVHQDGTPGLRRGRPQGQLHLQPPEAAGVTDGDQCGPVQRHAPHGAGPLRQRHRRGRRHDGRGGEGVHLVAGRGVRGHRSAGGRRRGGGHGKPRADALRT